ncbi:hypothetical protein PNOK_0121900 [Pyrrhoderma noxium]|uniref:Uncharacterized protein n=1 Tax=Pyrrhoderma noxium TaxID=2282107 RepID=A0A286UX59_9AGAM|nr:hypothetical protein PNOK_0121900 [Pyrrhoderma noxium]
MARLLTLFSLPIALCTLLVTASALPQANSGCLSPGVVCIVNPPGPVDHNCSYCCFGFTPALLPPQGVCN